MADKSATLTLKLGDREVRYEAEREAVEAQLEQIVGLLLKEAPAGRTRRGAAGIPGASAGGSAGPGAGGLGG